MRTAEDGTNPDMSIQHGSNSAADPNNHADVELMPTHIILFYKYTPLSTDTIKMEEYKSLLLTLTKALRLRGRLLLGRSLNEGLNGTFSGSYTALMCYEAAMGLEGSSNEKVSEANEETVTEYIRGHAVASTSTAASDRDAVDPALLSSYIPHVLAFLKSPLPVPNFTIPHAEFKWSKNIPSPSGELSQVFPDLFIKVVNEIIGTGGLLESIPIQEVRHLSK